MSLSRYKINNETHFCNYHFEPKYYHFESKCTYDLYFAALTAIIGPNIARES